jgi:hypothetical protein
MGQMLDRTAKPAGGASLDTMATVAGWGFDATNLGIVVSHSYRNLFTVRPDLVAFVPGLIAAALFMRNDIKHRHTRKRGFDLSEHK